MIKHIVLLLAVLLSTISLCAQVKVGALDKRLNDSLNYDIKDTFSRKPINAKIYALVKVSPEGYGTFIRLLEGSASKDSSYANAIKKYISKIKFNKADKESNIKMGFNFTSD